jgi:hypothetical protein
LSEAHEQSLYLVCPEGIVTTKLSELSSQNHGVTEDTVGDVVGDVVGFTVAT